MQFFAVAWTFVFVVPLSALHAAELITLQNGFRITCHHHAEIDGRTRLFLSGGDASYIEFSPQEIATVEVVADPPAPAEAAQTTLPSAQTASLEKKLDGKLTEADLHEILAKAGTAHDLDVDLLASLVKAESGGNTHAVSRTGARGLMQLMPKTADQMGVADSFQPEQNVRGGSAYLDVLLTRYHENLALALAAYNAGPAAVDKYHGIPPYAETRAYVARVIHEFNRRVRAREAHAAVR